MRNLFVTFFYVLALTCFCQTDDLAINQLDSLGLKSGLWLNYNWIVNYKNGIINGPYCGIEYDKTKADRYIVTVGYKQDGKQAGSIVDFYPNGVVATLLCNFIPNTDFVGAQQGYTKNAVLPYQCYQIDFYNDGKIKAEGWSIFTEDIEIDGGERVGLWKYYDTEGNVEIVDFSKPSSELKHSRYY